MHWGINPPQKHKTPLSCHPTLNLQSIQAPFFRQLPSLYWFFHNSPPVKIGFFSERQSFSFLTLSDPLKVSKFLVKISQFELLVMTEKNIFVYNFLCGYIFQILVYFLCKNCNPSPSKRSAPPPSHQPPLKIKVKSSIPVLKIW